VAVVIATSAASRAFTDVGVVGARAGVSAGSIDVGRAAVD